MLSPADGRADPDVCPPVSYDRIKPASRVWLVALLALLLAACGAPRQPEPTQIPGPAARQVAQIPEAPDWREPADVITRENISGIELLGRLDPPGEQLSTVFDYAFSIDGTELAGLNSDLLIVWDLISGERLVSRARHQVSLVYYAPDKTEVFAVDHDGVIVVHDAANGQIKTDLNAHADYNGTADFHPDQGWLALGGYDGSVRVWDPLERSALVTIEAHEREIRWLAFSPDGELLVTASDSGAVRLWDWRDRRLLAELENEQVTGRGAFSAAGDRLAISTERFINVWGLESAGGNLDARLLHTLQTGPGGASDVLKFSPDGRYLINGGALPDMMVWDAQTGTMAAQLPGVGGDRTSAAFSPDGELLVAAVLDGPVTLWDMTSITDETVVRADLQVGTDRVLIVDWSADGFTLLFFDAIGPIYVWGIAPDES
jgi:WD40 repeat protein